MNPTQQILAVARWVFPEFTWKADRDNGYPFRWGDDINHLPIYFNISDPVRGDANKLRLKLSGLGWTFKPGKPFLAIKHRQFHPIGEGKGPIPGPTEGTLKLDAKNYEHALLRAALYEIGGGDE